jgi:small nuclear ribonucleoprotein (snRNP)-like protein
VEYHGEDKKAGYSRVLIRGNNIMYVILGEK